MDEFLSIPEKVWEGRCRWCIHRLAEENQPVPKLWVYRYKNLPCRIMGLARCDEVDGECLSFAPNWIYGICKTCENNNCFHPGYCLLDDQPNKRQVYIGQHAYNHKPDYWHVHELSTCDAYSPSGAWIETMRRQALEGKIPRNFNPETMKPVGEGLEETKAAIRAWSDADLEQAKDAEAREAEKKRRLAEQIARDTNQLVGQMTMDLE